MVRDTGRCNPWEGRGEETAPVPTPVSVTVYNLEQKLTLLP